MIDRLFLQQTLNEIIYCPVCKGDLVLHTNDGLSYLSCVFKKRIKDDYLC